MKILDKYTIESLIEKMQFVDQKSSDIQDSNISSLFSIVNFLNLKSQEIMNEEEFDLENVKYSHYYWFCQFKNEYYKKYGKDEGLEQQAFRLLENMNVEFSNGVDWTIIEKIENGSI